MFKVTLNADINGIVPIQAPILTWVLALKPFKAGLTLRFVRVDILRGYNDENNLQ